MPPGPTPHACQSEAMFLNDPEVTELPDQSGIRRRKDQTFPEIRNTGTAGAEEIAEQHWNFWPEDPYCKAASVQWDRVPVAGPISNPCHQSQFRLSG